MCVCVCMVFFSVLRVCLCVDVRVYLDVQIDGLMRRRFVGGGFLVPNFILTKN